MLPPRFKSLALCLALLPLTLAPAAQKAERLEQHPWSPQHEQLRLHRDIIGFWELTSLTGDGITYTGANLKGYILFTPDHLAFEYHFSEAAAIRGYDVVGFQSGMQRYRFDGMGRMETTSLIGASSADIDEGVFLEEPGRPRAFLIELAGDHLVLAHTFSRFEYKRVPTMPYTDLEPGVNFDDWESVKEGKQSEE